MTDNRKKTDSLPHRLCTEIQLFDLCDLNACKHKSGRFCTDSALLERFEKIADEELRVPEQYLSEGIEDSEEDDIDSDSYDDEEDDLARDDYDDEE